MSVFTKLAAARLLLTGIVVATTRAVEHFGLPIPDGTADIINSLVDAVVVFGAFMVDGKVRDNA